MTTSATHLQRSSLTPVFTTGSGVCGVPGGRTLNTVTWRKVTVNTGTYYGSTLSPDADFPVPSGINIQHSDLTGVRAPARGQEKELHSHLAASGGSAGLGLTPDSLPRVLAVTAGSRAMSVTGSSASVRAGGAR